MISDQKPLASSCCQTIDSESTKTDENSFIIEVNSLEPASGDTSKDANPTVERLEPATAEDEDSTKTQGSGDDDSGLNHQQSGDSSLSVTWRSKEESPKTTLEPKIVEVYWEEPSFIRTTSSPDIISGHLFLTSMVHVNYLNKPTTHPTFCSEDVLYISPWIKADDKTVTNEQLKKGTDDSRDDFTKFIDGIGYIDRFRVKNLAVHLGIWESFKKTLLQNLTKFPELAVLILVAENLEHQATFGPINDDKDFQPLAFISTPFESVRIPVALEINETLQRENAKRKAITVEIKRVSRGGHVTCTSLDSHYGSSMRVGGSGEDGIGDQEMRKSPSEESFALDGSYDSDDELDLEDFDDGVGEMEDVNEDGHDNEDGLESSPTTCAVSKHIAATTTQTTNAASATVNDHDLEQPDFPALRTKIEALAYQTENLVIEPDVKGIAKHKFEDRPSRRSRRWSVTQAPDDLFNLPEAPEGATQANARDDDFKGVTPGSLRDPYWIWMTDMEDNPDTGDSGNCVDH